MKCPICGSTRLTKHLSEDVELAYECKDCYWVGLQPEED
jgi:predicted RNA-binding Zn-ribbon protein involved in translation (DUF1610 family)